MRWPWTRSGPPGRLAGELRDAVDTVDLDAVEIVELDADGRLVGPHRRADDDSLRELADHPSRRDPTGTAGIWEAIAHS